MWGKNRKVYGNLQIYMCVIFQIRSIQCSLSLGASNLQE
jgi:hypothetical protein